MDLNKAFSAAATRTSRATGSPWAFGLCVAAVVIWAATGPIFHFSETWQLVINTGTTIITFLMVFLIQNSQNRDGMAIQTKLDELILSSSAENDFIGIEKLTDKELEALQARCSKAAEGHTRLAQSAAKTLDRRRGQQKPRPAGVKPKRKPGRAAHG